MTCTEFEQGAALRGEKNADAGKKQLPAKSAILPKSASVKPTARK